MAYHEQQYKRRISLAQANNALIALISINVIIFIILASLKAIFLVQYRNNEEAFNFFNTHVLNQFSLAAQPEKIISRPWTVLSHMFTHSNVWRLLGNMLWLWLFGYIFLDLTGNRKIVPLYIYGCLAGALAFVLCYNLMPSLRLHLADGVIMGAQPGVIAIAVAVTMIAPVYRIFPMILGGIPLWILTTIYLVVDLASISLNNTAEYTAHLAGALTGFLFIYSFRKGYDWSEWMSNFFDWVSNLFNPEKPRKGKNIKQELFYKSSTRPFKKTPNITEQRINEILDKINQKGFNSLSEEEKELLKRASQEK